MKQLFLRLSLIAVLGCGFTLTSCKDKKKETTTTTTPETTTTTTPVEVSGDETLRSGAMTAVKDFPGVSATVANGEIKVSGTIKRDDWQTLKPRLDALSPKKVNNQQLTIQ